MAESLAYEITKAVPEHTPELTAALPAAKEITSMSAVLGSSIPFHPGAGNLVWPLWVDSVEKE